MFPLSFLEDVREMDHRDLESLLETVDRALAHDVPATAAHELAEASTSELVALKSYAVAQINALDIFTELLP